VSRAVAGALLAAAAALACAQPGRPPGGEVDQSPPRVVETRPAAFDTITDLTDPVVIVFDERLSIRYQGVTELQDAVLISPARGVPIVDRSGRRVTIRAAGGWEPDRVYRVVLLPVYSDLFRNRREEPVDLVFSTGAPITETALAGFVTDRLTGQTVADARVQATRRIDGEQYVAVTDTGGFFALRFVPAGAYDVRSWIDQDRDAEPDFFEAQDTADTAFGIGDTAVVELAVLPMDTTPARLARVEAIDSAKLRLVFDDYFAPGPVEGETRLYLLPDTTLVTTSGRLVHATRLDSILAAEAAVRAARDSARAAIAREDSIRALRDSLAAMPDSIRPSADSIQTLLGEAAGPPRDTTARAGPPVQPRPGADRARPRRAPRPGGQAAQEKGPLPAQELVLLLPGTLTPDTTYFLEVDGVVNIRNLPGGGGAAAFRSPAPDTAAADTATADTTAVDTIPADTIPPDTIPPDTVPAVRASTAPAAAGRPGRRGGGR
jgi:hypothetical protein